jgi:uncharacterized membrane protein YraQ (UPF0718 family)
MGYALSKTDRINALPEPLLSNRSLPRRATITPALAVMTVVLTAIVGLAIVKWIPYYQKAQVAAHAHSIGPSILFGSANHAPAPSFQAALDYARAYAKAIWKAMVLGLLLGSAVQALLPRGWIARGLGRRGFGPLVLAGVLSVPSMMCTCCAAPVVAGLRECRAAPGSAVAYWLGNTVLNPATLIFTGFVLGWRWTSLRLTLGAIMVFGLGALVNRVARSEDVVVQPGARPEIPQEPPSFTRWLNMLGRMSLGLIPEYVVLVLLLGAARAWLFPHVGHEVDNSLPWILAFALAGAVFVIPTAGEIPIVQGMLALGVGTGPAAALLITLPPIGAPSGAMLWRHLGPRTLCVVSVGVVLLGVLGGCLADWLF